jgi:Lon protease-like protein
MIRDFDNLPDGLLGITVEGIQRFRCLSVKVQPDMLNVAEVILLDDAEVSVPPEYGYLKEYLFELLMEHGVDINEELVAMTDNAGWLGYRLMDLLPLSMLNKQRMLEQDDPLQRFKMLKQHLT